MAGSLVRISESGRQVLRELTLQLGESTQVILDRALEQYRRKCFLDGLAADFAALRGDMGAWASELAERRLEDNALMDGLDADEFWTPDGNLAERPRRRKKA